MSIVFSVYSPYLDLTITLTKNTWFKHIVPNHPEVENRINLIKEALEKKDNSAKIFYRRNDANRVAIFKPCVHLKPCNNYIKIALKVTGEKKAIITTCHGSWECPVISNNK